MVMKDPTTKRSRCVYIYSPHSDKKDVKYTLDCGMPEVISFKYFSANNNQKNYFGVGNALYYTGSV
jgi:hypothetical protein